jgi:hypothetical protein
MLEHDIKKAAGRPREWNSPDLLLVTGCLSYDSEFGLVGAS